MAQGINGVASVVVTAIPEKPADMSALELTRMERIARNLPIHDLVMRYAPTPHGKIYMAYGKLSDGSWQGMWGIRGVARLCEFGAALTEPDIEAGMIRDALWYAGEADKRAMFERGFWQAGHA